jgi:hypothetical protein
MAKVDGQSEIELLPVSALEFYIVEGPVRILFEKDADGKTTGFKGWQNGQSFVVKKTK